MFCVIWFRLHEHLTNRGLSTSLMRYIKDHYCLGKCFELAWLEFTFRFEHSVLISFIFFHSSETPYFQPNIDA